jgi:hypothetical protein
MRIENSSLLIKGREMYYELTYSDKPDTQTVGDYEMGNIDPTLPWKLKKYKGKTFDLTVFWKGKKFRGQIPDYVKLYIRKGDENLPAPDLLPNPVSWCIFSRRMLDICWPLIKDDVQVFDAPIYLCDGTKIEGYKLVNPIRMLDCLDKELSEGIMEKDGNVSYCGKLYIKEYNVGKHNIFRLSDWFPPVIISEELFQMLNGKGLIGVAGILCGTSPYIHNTATSGR